MTYCEQIAHSESESGHTGDVMSSACEGFSKYEKKVQTFNQVVCGTSFKNEGAEAAALTLLTSIRPVGATTAEILIYSHCSEI